MRIEFITACLAATAIAVPASAADPQAVLWKDVGDWSIRVIEDGRSFCQASAYWPGGTQVSLGFQRNQQTPRLVVSNPQWQTNGRTSGYDLIVQFGTQTPWRVPSQQASSEAGTIDLRIEGRDLLFFEEMMGVSNFGVRFGDQTVANFEMSGAFDALVELGNCQLNVAGQTKYASANTL